MSQVAISGNASGTGTLTIAAPNTNSNYTLTLPIGTGTFNISSVVNEVPAGTVSAPSIYPTGDTNTGIFFPAADTVAFSEGGAEAMRIDSSGNLLVGATATTSNARLAVTTSSTSNLDYGIYAKNSGGAFLLGIDNNGGFSTGTAAGSPYNATTATAANTVVDSAGALKRSTSSIKYKTDVRDATHGLVDLLKLRSVTYKGKNDGDTIFGGLIAEEVDAAGLTEFVQYADDGTPDALAYGNMVSLCIKAIQEQQALIQQLQADVAALKGK